MSKPQRSDPERFDFAPVEGRAVVASFDGGDATAPTNRWETGTGAVKADVPDLIAQQFPCSISPEFAFKINWNSVQDRRDSAFTIHRNAQHGR